MTDNCAGQAPPENEAEREARLMRFYCVETRAALLVAMERHITKLQERQRGPLGLERSGVVREG